MEVLRTTQLSDKAAAKILKKFVEAKTEEENADLMMNEEVKAQLSQVLAHLEGKKVKKNSTEEADQAGAGCRHRAAVEGGAQVEADNVAAVETLAADQRAPTSPTNWSVQGVTSSGTGAPCSTMHCAPESLSRQGGLGIHRSRQRGRAIAKPYMHHARHVQHLRRISYRQQLKIQESLYNLRSPSLCLPPPTNVCNAWHCLQLRTAASISIASNRLPSTTTVNVAPPLIETAAILPGGTPVAAASHNRPRERWSSVRSLLNAICNVS